VHGGLIVAMGDGFMMIDPASSIIETVASPEAHLPDTRMNDGRTDRQGRFWAGSICEVPGEPCRPIGGLYRLDADLTCTKMVGDIAISNGLAWSVDGNIMYHADSITPFVWQWDYDVRNGEIANRKVFLNLSEIGAVADGATIDSEGCYWIALPFKGKVHRYDPAGKLMWSIDMPVDAPTCCEFGGANLDILYVTSATFGRGADALRDQPLAGGLFALDVGVKGVAATRFAG
jgi:sugar lactone lactonase YvrE